MTRDIRIQVIAAAPEGVTIGGRAHDHDPWRVVPQCTSCQEEAALRAETGGQGA